ncbi:MAG: hypothetical protein AB4062_08755 [Crocosphaera sp.]
MKKKIKEFRGDVNVFLTEEMRRVALTQALDYEHLEIAFKKTFDILNETTGDDTFKKYKSEKKRFLGGFYYLLLK